MRQRAALWHLAPERVGFMGFSAGAMVTSGTVLQDDAAGRPAFAALVYGAPFGALPAIPSKLPFHRALEAAGHRPEAHVYGAGGHGFGLRTQGTTSDHWIEAFYDWLEAQGLTRKAPAQAR